MNTPKVTMRSRPSFAAVVAAPSKNDRIGQLQRALDQLMEENRDLKARLGKLEARFDSMVDLATDKVREVEVKVTNAQSVALAK
ncbi:hypothetical protein GOP47_0030827, partial [Adiantum capillus-veneris]